MSTVRENIVANHIGMQEFAISVVTDPGIREEENIITHEEVLQDAKKPNPNWLYCLKNWKQPK
jgi:purine-nucleoside phosphorylase